MLKKTLDIRLTWRLIAVAVLVGFGWYLKNNQHLIGPLLSVPLYLLAVIILLRLILIISNGIFTVLTLEAFNKKIQNTEAAYVALLTTIGNYFGPVLGGTSIRAVYLKKRHGFPISTFIGTVYGYYLISFFVTSLIGLGGLLYLRISNGVFSWPVLIVFVSLLLTTGSLLIIKRPNKTEGNTSEELPNGLTRKLRSTWDGWQVISNKDNLLKKMFLLGLGLFVVESLVFYLEFLALNINISFSSLIVYSALGAISLLVNITPGAIGIRESIYLFSSNLLGLSSGEIIQVAALDRGITLLVIAAAYIYMQASKKYSSFVEFSSS